MPTTPPTWSPNTIVASSDLQLLSDAILELQARADGTDYVGVRVVRTTNQSISNSTQTSISFSAQSYDLGGAWSSGTNVVVPAAWIPAGATTVAIRGIARVRFSNNATGVRNVEIVREGTTFAQNIEPGYASDDTHVLVVDVDPDAEAGDVITLDVTQNSGGALNVEFASLTIERAGTTS